MKPSKLPRSVKVGWATYRIVEWTATQGAGARRYGECSSLALEIRIDPTHGPMHAAQTLLHEILHAICAVWQLGDKDDEERIVASLSNGLSTVWRDNPEVMAWVAQHHR